MIRVVLPSPLRALAQVGAEISVLVSGEITIRRVLDVVEAQHPALRGTLRDQVTQQRRAFVRFFACERDRSHDSPDTPLAPTVASGQEPLLIVGAMAGG